MSQDGKEDLIARLTASSKRYEILENLVHEAHFLGIEDIFISTQCSRNMFGKEYFCEIFKGFIFLRNHRDFFSRKPIRDGSFDILGNPSEFVRFGLEDILRDTSSLSMMGIEGFDCSWEDISDGVCRRVHKST